MLWMWLISLSLGQDMCVLEEKNILEEIKLPMSPEWFFKPIPAQNSGDKRRDFSFISAGNWMYDAKSGELSRIPGSVDGVLSPDGELLIAPGLVFYDRDQLRDPDIEPLYDDTKNGKNKLDGVYHSSGIVSEDATSKTYRMITDTITERQQVDGTGPFVRVGLENLYYKDYHTKKGPNGPEFSANTQAPRLLCSNMKGQLMKLPMLSKNGRQLAAYDPKTNTTKIFDIVERDGNSECNLKMDLGIATGKVEFSPDGKRIVFAAQSEGTFPDSVEWYAQPYSGDGLEVYTIDLEKQKIKKLSAQNNGNAYYPSFSDDNTVVFLSQNWDKSEPPKDSYSIMRATLNAEEAPVFIPSDDSCKMPVDALSALVVGDMWAKVCREMSRKDMEVSTRAYFSLGLTRDQCADLVSTHWKKYREEIQSAVDRNIESEDQMVAYYEGFLRLDEGDLLKTCSALIPDGQKNRKVVVTPKKVGDGTHSTDHPMAVCWQCHGATFDFSKPETLTPFKKKLKAHVESGFMPKNVEIERETRKRILEWIRTQIPD